MARRPPSLIRAARGAVREDRLTEILAVALAIHRPFADRFLDEADLPRGDTVEISTQVGTQGRSRIDLQLVSLDGRGHVLSRLWSEHKTGSPFSRNQLQGYAAELADQFSGRRQLITIVNRLDEAPEDDRWKRLTWRRVAVMAAEAGAKRDGSNGLHWRKQADSPHAPADQRLLHELLTYLEEEHNTVIDPISHLDVIALSRRQRAKEAVTNVMNRAAEISHLDPDGSTGGVPGAKDEYRQKFKLASSWADRLGGDAELRASPQDSWAFPRVDEPAFGVGFTLSGKYHDHLRESSNSDWLTAVEALDFSVALVDGNTRVYRTLYVAELIAKGATIDQQAASLAGWIEESIALLVEHDPGIEPIGRRSEGKTASFALEGENTAPNEAEI